MAPSPENDFPESDRTADNMFFVEKQAEIVQQIQDLAAEERYKILQRIMEKQSSQLKEDIDKKFEEMDEMIAKKGSLVEASKFGKDLFGYVWPYATFNKKVGRLLEGTLNTHVQAYMLAEVKDLAVEERFGVSSSTPTSLCMVLRQGNSKPERPSLLSFKPIHNELRDSA
jgi:hypothetical protein